MIDVKTTDNECLWQINTDLSNDTVMMIKNALKPYYSQLTQTTKFKNWTIELENNQTIDSAGLSWLLIQKKHAIKHNLSLSIKNLNTNQKAVELAKAQGVYDLLI